MKTICGNETSKSTCWVKVLVLTAVFAVALLATGAHDARADQAPAPQKLWRLFPLDARGHSAPASQSNAGTATVTTSEPRGRGTPMSAMAWAATAGAIVVALLAVAVIAGRTRVHFPSRLRRNSLRRPPARERVAELVEAPRNKARRPTATVVNGRRRSPLRVVRAPSRESEQAVLKRKGATLGADADAKLRAKSRNGSSRDDDLVLLKAKQERKP